MSTAEAARASVDATMAEMRAPCTHVKPREEKPSTKRMTGGGRGREEEGGGGRKGHGRANVGG